MSLILNFYQYALRSVKYFVFFKYSKEVMTQILLLLIELLII